MADASEEISDDVWGVIGLIFLVVVGYWFFSEDDIEDVASTRSNQPLMAMKMRLLSLMPITSIGAAVSICGS